MVSAQSGWRPPGIGWEVALLRPFKNSMMLPPLGVSPGEVETCVPKRVPRNGDSDIIAFSSKTVPTEASVTRRVDEQAGAPLYHELLFSNRKGRVT